MAFNQDTYRKWILPALGVAETIATRGKSPGNIALGQEQIFRDVEQGDLRKKQIEAQIAAQEEEAAANAFKRQLEPYQVQDAIRKQKTAQEQEASIAAFRKALGGDTSLGESDRSYYSAYPEKYGERLKPASNIYLPGEGGYVSVPNKGKGTAAPVTDDKGNPIKPRQPNPPKSLVDIEREATARAKGATAGQGEKPLSGDAAKLKGIVTSALTRAAELRAKVKQYGARGVVERFTTGSDPDLVNIIQDMGDLKGRLRSGGAVNPDENTRFISPFSAKSKFVFADDAAMLRAIDRMEQEARTVSDGMSRPGDAPAAAPASTAVKWILDPQTGKLRPE